MSSAKGRYPLEAARTLRQDAVEVAQRALADALGAVELAAHARERAAQRVREHATRLKTERRLEAQKDSAGRSAAEMMTGQAWITRLESERAQKQRVLSEAESAVQSAEQEANALRDALGHARAEAEAVEKHRQGWESERKRARLAKEEAEAEEHATRRGR